MTSILGISAFYHDSAAVLVIDGEIIAAAQEERFTRRKHDQDFPQHSIEYCLAQAGLKPRDLDYVGYYEKPLLKFERLIETFLAFAPRGYRAFRLAVPRWLQQRLHIPREIRSRLPGFTGQIVFAEHHESHAASAFFPSPFSEAAILTMDGVGEWSTTCIGHGRNNRIELQKEIRYPHSLGLLYSAFTYYLGFRVNSSEYKVMGLAPYGVPRFRDLILKHLVDLRDDGSFQFDMSYFNYGHGLTMTSAKFHELLGGPPRKPEAPLSQREMDLAASIQSVTSEAMLNLARAAHRFTGSDHLVMAGGVALNCVGNGEISRAGLFKQIWIQPASGDAGGALGVAQFIWHQLLDKPRSPRSTDSQRGSLLGPAFNAEQITQTLREQDAIFRSFPDDESLCQETTKLLAEGKVVGWFQGRMEFGPRALGARSILADPRIANMQSILNQKIKFRESFRPFAPIVLEEFASEYFDLPAQQDSPYMLLVAPVTESQRVSKNSKETLSPDLKRFADLRSSIPAVTHIDYSARIQTVDRYRNPLLRKLLEQFRELTGCPVLINTSFNVRNEPIVCTPLEAYRCFMMTDMDVLVIGRQLLVKSEQSRSVNWKQRQSYLSGMEPD